MDVQLLNLWFKRGYGSREMAMLLLIAEQAEDTLKLTNPYQLGDRFDTIHEEVCKIIYSK